MEQKLEQIGITSDYLDGIVDQVSRDMSVTANNGGLKGQLDFLVASGYAEKDIWKAILVKHLGPEMTVDVDDPKHDDSPHNCSFSGNVVEVTNNTVRVRDYEDSFWDVEFDEITSFSFCAPTKCSKCAASIIRPSSVIREYMNKDGGKSVFAIGHYSKGGFISDEFNGFAGGCYDLRDDSDKCANCETLI